MKEREVKQTEREREVKQTEREREVKQMERERGEADGKRVQDGVTMLM